MVGIILGFFPGGTVTHRAMGFFSSGPTSLSTMPRSRTHGGRLFFQRGGEEKTSKIVVPSNMGFEEGILFALLGEG